MRGHMRERDVRPSSCHLQVFSFAEWEGLVMIMHDHVRRYTIVLVRDVEANHLPSHHRMIGSAMIVPTEARKGRDDAR